MNNNVLSSFLAYEVLQRLLDLDIILFIITGWTHFHSSPIFFGSRMYWIGYDEYRIRWINDVYLISTSCSAWIRQSDVHLFHSLRVLQQSTLHTIIHILIGMRIHASGITYYLLHKGKQNISGYIQK